MSHYSPSSISMIGDLNPSRGIVCRTATTNNTLLFKTTAVNVFKVTGRIKIVSLDIEAVTAFSATASVPRWQFVGTTPSVALTDIGAASASLSALAVGKRVMLAGTALNTAMVIDAVAGITLKPVDTMQVGWDGGVCHLAVDADVAQTSGTCIITLCYLPMSDGAGVEALF